MGAILANPKSLWHRQKGASCKNNKNKKKLEKKQAAHQAKKIQAGASRLKIKMPHKKYNLTKERIDAFLGKMAEDKKTQFFYSGSENNINGVFIYDIDNVAVILSNFVYYGKDKHNLYIVGKPEDIMKTASELEEKLGFELGEVKD